MELKQHEQQTVTRVCKQYKMLENEVGKTF